MIDQIYGKILNKQPTFVSIDVQGIGYGIHISLNTYKNISKDSKNIKLYTYLYVRENIMELYGFYETLEKNLFLKLITVSGIGAKMALRILSENPPSVFIKYILEENFDQLIKFKGVGKKMAQVLIASLKPPLEKISNKELFTIASTNISKYPVSNQIINDAIAALISLGIKENPAKEIIQKLTNKKDYQKIEDLISEALNKI